MTLEQAERGDRLIIKDIADPEVKVKAIRFGVTEGAEITCAEKLPSGPIVIRKGRQEIAIGRRLAQRILVEPAGETTPGKKHRHRHRRRLGWLFYN